MDVLLLSFEARCMLDGIRRRLKKTGSSLSLYLSLSLSVTFHLSLHPECLEGESEIWMEEKIERLMESK